MTPLERAAQTLFETRREQLPCIAYPAISGEWEAQFRSVKDRYVNEARAVLTAIREPSEHAMDSGAYRLPGIDTEAKQTKSRDVYRAMIDAMLEEGA